MELLGSHWWSENQNSICRDALIMTSGNSYAVVKPRFTNHINLLFHMCDLFYSKYYIIRTSLNSMNFIVIIALTDYDH